LLLYFLKPSSATNVTIQLGAEPKILIRGPPYKKYKGRTSFITSNLSSLS